jgi:hypothetical protein
MVLLLQLHSSKLHGFDILRVPLGASHLISRRGSAAAQFLEGLDKSSSTRTQQ